MADIGVIDTGFRSAVRKLDRAGRMLHVHDRLDPYLEVAAFVKNHDGDRALFFERVGDYAVPVCANLLACHANILTVFGLDVQGVRAAVERGIHRPLPPRLVDGGPCQDVVVRDGIDLGTMFPVLHHMPGDAGRFFTASVVIARDPETGTRNASFHRLQLLGGNETALKLDLGRHLRLLYGKAQRKAEALPIAVVIGGDLSLAFAAGSMGAHLPLERDELEMASGLRGAPLEVVKCLTVDLEVPAESEIVLEGELLPDRAVIEGPFLEFTGLYAEAGPSPVFRVHAVTHRRQPIYYTVAGGEVRLLRKPLMEAGILRSIRNAVPIVQDVELTPGGLCRFHLVIAVRKERPEDEGLQRNAIFAAIAALKDLDLITVVDNDIDIRDPRAVEWAVAMRFEASRDLILMPGARGHEYVPASEGGIRTKVGIDATVPFGRLDEVRRVPVPPLPREDYATSVGPGAETSHPVFGG